MKESTETRLERLERLGVTCPVCQSTRTSTRRIDQMRRCQRCGEEWPRIIPK